MRKLDEVIREFYIERLMASQIDDRYPNFLQIATTGLKDLNYDIQQIVNTEILPVNDNLTVTLPPDYIDYQMIGVVCGNNISSLGLNENQAPLNTNSCGNPVARISNNGNYEGYFLDYNSANWSEDGEYLGRHYGAGGGGNSNGTYKVYKAEGYIALNNFSGDEIVLRYVTNLKKVNGNFMVDEYLVEAVKDFIWWTYVKANRSYGLGERQMAHEDYKRTKKEALIRSTRWNFPEFLNAWNTGFRSSPRM